MQPDPMQSDPMQPDPMQPGPTTDPYRPEGLDGVLGLEILSADGDRVTARLPVAEHLHQPYGIVHGGVYCTVVETCASIGGAMWFGERGQVVGVSNSTNFLRAVREGVLEVEATPVHRGRTQQLWQVVVTAGGKTVARGEVRLANIVPEQIGG